MQKSRNVSTENKTQDELGTTKGSIKIWMLRNEEAKVKVKTVNQLQPYLISSFCLQTDASDEGKPGQAEKKIMKWIGSQLSQKQKSKAIYVLQEKNKRETPYVQDVHLFWNTCVS